VRDRERAQRDPAGAQEKRGLVQCRRAVPLPFQILPDIIIEQGCCAIYSAARRVDESAGIA
jgi:hypothetical protein